MDIETKLMVNWFVWFTINDVSRRALEIRTGMSGPCEDVDEQAIQTDDRCHIIKVLQEQIQGLRFYKDDYEQMKQRCRIAEQAFKMREAEVKMKFEDVEDTLAQLTAENRQLKEQISRQYRQAVQRQDNEKQEENVYETKYMKWKTKYHALAQANPEAQEHIEFEKTKMLLEQSQRQNQQLLAEKEVQQDQIMKLTQLIQTHKEEIKESARATVEASVLSEKLKTENEQLKQENEKLQTVTKHKTTLLRHSRAQRDKQNKSKSQSQQTSSSESEDERKLKQKNAEITKLTNALELETTARKKAEMMCRKMKKQNTAAITKLQEAMKQVTEDRNRLEKSLIESEESKASMSEQIEGLQGENQKLTKSLSKADQIARKKKALENTVAEMQETIEQLQGSLSSFASDSTVKEEELRNLLIRNWGGDAIGFHWSECLVMIGDKFTALKTAESELTKLQDQVKKLQKKNKSLTDEIEARRKAILESNRSIEEGEESGATNTPSATDNQDLTLPPQVILKQLPDKFAGINKFRHCLVRRMNKLYFQMCDDVKELSQALTEKTRTKTEEEEEEEYEDTGLSFSFRSCIYMVVMAQRWQKFNKKDPLDNNAILEYCGSSHRRQRSKLTNLVAKVQDAMARLRQEKAANGLLTKANKELMDKMKKAEAEMRKAEEELLVERERKQRMTKDLERAEMRCVEMIDPAKHAELQQQLDVAIQERKKYEDQLSAMKVEMKNLIDSLDGGQFEMSDLQEQIITLTDENEGYKHELISLREELSVTTAALKDRTRELLALERKLMKEKKKFVVVKDTIPLTAQPTKNEVLHADGRFLTEAVRGGLAQIQTRLLTKETAI